MDVRRQSNPSFFGKVPAVRRTASCAASETICQYDISPCCSPSPCFRSQCFRARKSLLPPLLFTLHPSLTTQPALFTIFQPSLDSLSVPLNSSLFSYQFSLPPIAFSRSSSRFSFSPSSRFSLEIALATFAADPRGFSP